MSTLEWTEALVLDLPAMDDTHREFVDLLAAVEAADDAQLLGRWQALIDHTEMHFDQEDRWMRETGFSSVNCHSTQHRVVLQVMREGAVAAVQGRLEVPRQMALELAHWFAQHAQSMDAGLALHLRSVGFDVKTGQLQRPDLLPQEAMAGCGSQSCSPTAAASQAEANAVAEPG